MRETALAATKTAKVYRSGSRADLRVPFKQVQLSSSPDGTPNPPVLLYDTSGPGCRPEEGLGALRLGWIQEREDTDELPGRQPSLRDDGRAALRAGSRPPAFEGRPHQVRRARPGTRVTQMAYARRGVVTPEMEFAAIREGVDPE